MARKRNKKRLTAKQANRISLGIVSIYLVPTIVNGLISKPAEPFFYWGFCVVTGSSMLYMLLALIIFDVEGRNLEEEMEMKRTKVRKILPKDYTEVEFIYENRGSAVKMMKEILQKEGCRYYAKLSENNTVLLSVKDKDGEEVYHTEIDNLNYFDETFRI